MGGGFGGWGNRFQPTHPVRGATWVKGRRAAYFTEFQPTHPVRGATYKL